MIYLVTVAEIDIRIQQLENQKKSFIAKNNFTESKKQRNLRFKRLVEKGALVEKYLGMIEKDDLEKILNSLKNKV